MRGAGLACVVAVLAAGCLEAPPSATGAGDGGQTGDAGADGFRFPPAGAAVNVVAALVADVDADGRQDLLVIDNDIDDDWAGVYVLRADAGGWSRLDEIRLDFRPTAAHFGQEVTAGPSLVVGGMAGKVAVVDYDPDGDKWVISPLEFDTPASGDIRLVRTGVVTSGDEAASLLLDDGADLSVSSPIDTAAPMDLSTFVAGGVLDAVFWPLDSRAPMDFIVWRRTTQLDWYDGIVYGGPFTADVMTSHFAEVEADLCGAHLGLGTSNTLSVGWIDCDGSDGHLAPVTGSQIPLVRAIATGLLAGGPVRDIALIGLDDGSLAGQVLVDPVLVDDAGDLALIPAAATNPVEIPGAAPDTVQLAVVDVEIDDSALLYAIAPSGVISCGEVGADAIVACQPRWQITGP